MGPFSAGLIERYGVRAMHTTAISLIITGLLSALLMTQLWHLVLLWGLVVGVGTGLTAVVLGAIVSTRWFSRHRGLVLGMLTASNATGQLVFLPFAAWLVSHVGWRMALIPSIAALSVAALLVVLFMRDRPADVGLLPLGDTVAPPVPPRQSPITQAFGAFAEGSRSSTFWVLFGTFFVCGLAPTVIQTHFIALCADYGIAATAAARRARHDGRVRLRRHDMSGWLSDRYDGRWLLFWYYGLRGLSLLYLPFCVLALRAVAVRGVLRARLDRDGAADGAPTGPFGRGTRRSFSAGSSPGISWGRRRPRSERGLTRHRVRDLPAGVLHRGRRVPRCGSPGNQQHSPRRRAPPSRRAGLSYTGFRST